MNVRATRVEISEIVWMKSPVSRANVIPDTTACSVKKVNHVYHGDCLDIILNCLYMYSSYNDHFVELQFALDRYHDVPGYVY